MLIDISKYKIRYHEYGNDPTKITRILLIGSKELIELKDWLTNLSNKDQILNKNLEFVFNNKDYKIRFLDEKNIIEFCCITDDFNSKQVKEFISKDPDPRRQIPEKICIYNKTSFFDKKMSIEEIYSIIEEMIKET